MAYTRHYHVFIDPNGAVTVALLFAICPACGESHAVRSNGIMSIHTTEQGQRCTPAPPPPTTPRPAKRGPVVKVEEDEPSELDAAFAVANERKKPSQRDMPPPFDRGIYVTRGAYAIRGGLPTLGKGR